MVDKMRKVKVEIKSKITVVVDEDADFTEEMDNIDCTFTTESDKTDILRTEITDWKVLDSK